VESDEPEGVDDLTEDENDVQVVLPTMPPPVRNIITNINKAAEAADTGACSGTEGQGGVDPLEVSKRDMAALINILETSGELGLMGPPSSIPVAGSGGGSVAGSGGGSVVGHCGESVAGSGGGSVVGHGGGLVVGSGGGSVVGHGGGSVVGHGGGSVVGSGGGAAIGSGGGSMEMSGFKRGVTTTRGGGESVGRRGCVTSSTPVDQPSVVTPVSLPPIGTILTPRNTSMGTNVSVMADSGEVNIRPRPLALTVPKKRIQAVQPVATMDDYGLTISDDEDECNESVMSSAQHSVRSRKRAADGSLEREVTVTGAGAQMELVQGVARDLFLRTATPVAQAPPVRRTPNEIMNEGRFEADDRREALEETLRNRERVVSGGVRRVIATPKEIEYGEQLACEIYLFVQDLPSPWTTERVMAASGDKFTHLDQCTFKAMVAMVIVSMRNTAQELLKGGMPQGAPMPETVAVHLDIDQVCLHSGPKS